MNHGTHTGHETVRAIGLTFSLVLAAFWCASASGEVAGTQPTSQPATAPALVSAPKKADEYLTLEQLVQAYREKQYALLVRESARLLGNPKLRGSYDRFSVLVLRAESQLQLKQFAVAVKEFKAAAEEAPNADKKALMGATAMLLERRKGTTYVPKFTDVYGNLVPNPGAAPGKPAPTIDLLDLSQRQNALRALFWDGFCVLRTKIQQTRTMPQIGEHLASLKALSTLETAAGAQQAESKKLRGELAAIAEAIMSNAVVQIEKQVERAVEDSKQLEPVPPDPHATAEDLRRESRLRSQGVGPEMRMKGFSLRTTEQIHGFEDFLGKVPSAVEELVGELQTDRKPFEPLLEKAASTKKSIRTVLDEYSRTGLLR